MIAAKGIGTAAGLDPFVVGATLVAFGTSSPELAAAMVARRRGHEEIGLGTVLGSNVFNNLWIVGVVAVIEPIRQPVDEVLVAIGAGIASLVLVVPTPGGLVPRWRGAALIALGAGYLVTTVLLGR